MPKKRQKPIELLTEAEILGLLTAAGTKATRQRNPAPSATGTRNRALLAVLYFAGLRVSEALALKPADLDLANRQINVRRGKGAKQRIAALIPAGIPYLEAWLDRRRQLGIDARRPLFCTHAGGPLADAYVRNLVRRLADKAEIDKRCHPHQLRHSHATWLANKRTPIHVISKQLGHSSVAVTAQYLDSISGADVAQAISSLEWSAA